MPYIFTFYGKKFVVTIRQAPLPTDRTPVTPATMLTILKKKHAHQDLPDNCLKIRGGCYRKIVTITGRMKSMRFAKKN